MEQYKDCGSPNWLCSNSIRRALLKEREDKNIICIAPSLLLNLWGRDPQTCSFKGIYHNSDILPGVGTTGTHTSTKQSLSIPTSGFTYRKREKAGEMIYYTSTYIHIYVYEIHKYIIL